MSDLLRQIQIVEWLSQASRIGIPMKNGSGFFVSKGVIVRLKSGDEVDCMEWLESEGLKNGMSIGGYTVKHASETQDFPERLFFFRNIVATDAPF